MTHTTDPHAMVRPASSAQVGLLALGWTVTDTLDGWDHMEPPGGLPVLIRSTHDAFEPPVEQELESRITLREVNKGPLDMLVVTAEDLDADDIEELRKQVDMALQDPDFSIVANFDINLTVVKFPEPDSPGPYDTLRHLWNQGALTPASVASAIQHQALLARLSEGSGVRVGGEVLLNRVLLAEERSTRGSCHRCGSPHIDLEAALARPPRPGETMLLRAREAQAGGALLFDCEPHQVSGIADEQSFWCFQLDPEYTPVAVADLRSQGRLVDHPELGHPAVVVRPEDSLDSWRALGWTLNEKCEQCRYPWHDGICACGGWGVDEERRAEEWHKAHPDGRE